MLSNVFLHYVLDLWFEQEVQPRLRHRAFLIRFADDFVVGFRDHRDAQRVMEVLPKRFGKYGLTIHPDKTQLVSFRVPSSTATGRDQPPERPGTFDFLGFTHFWRDLDEVNGSSDARRPPIDSASQCGALTLGVGEIGTN